MVLRFNPLTGIRSFLTQPPEASILIYSADGGFNPLTGIRSFLTAEHELCDQLAGTIIAFQSPHGDSFFSDMTCQKNTFTDTREGTAFQSPHGDSFFSDYLKMMLPSTKNGFQSPHGDSFFSDRKHEIRWPEHRHAKMKVSVSIPSRGFVLF